MSRNAAALTAIWGVYLALAIGSTGLAQGTQADGALTGGPAANNKSTASPSDIRNALNSLYSRSYRSRPHHPPQTGVNPAYLQQAYLQQQLALEQQQAQEKAQKREAARERKLESARDRRAKELQLREQKRQEREAEKEAEKEREQKNASRKDATPKD